MRQTTQAVALLLSAANAADITALTVDNATGWQGTTSVVINPLAASADAATQLASRTATFYNYRKLATPVTWQTNVYAGGYLPQTTRWSLRSVKKGSSCVNCIMNNGVWCSATFNYWLTGVADYAYLATTQAASVESGIATTDAEMSSGLNDRGSCCNSKIEFTKLTGYVGQGAVLPTYGNSDATTGNTAGTGSAADLGAPNVGVACVANTQTGAVVIDTASNPAPTGNKFNQVAWESSAVAFMGWWCSNGLYKKVKGTTSSDGSLNITQTFMQNSNPRTELALVGCPNRAETCADTAGIKALVDTTTPWVIDMGTGKNDLTISNKCTWVATSYLQAPSFVVEAGTGDKGITTDWLMHVMEYTTTTDVYAASVGALSSKIGGVKGFTQTNLAQDVDANNFIPRFDMNQSSFATLRTWYGYIDYVPANSINTMVGGVETGSQFGAQLASWFAPGQNGFLNSKANNVLTANKSQQFYGNVASIGTSVLYSGTTAPSATAGNYGELNNQKFDFRTVRYVPASTVQSTYKAGQDLATAYNAKVTSYNTAKTVWNNYVAILAKNAKMDAFAAAFSPPKAPTVPPLPNLPWTPATYSGGLKQTTLQAYLQLKNTGKFSSTAQPASNTWWLSLDAAQSIGGWGSWTAQVMTYRAGWGKSFGTIGFGGGKQDSMNYVWNNNWMCPDRTTAVTQSDTSPCGQNVYTAGSGSSVDAPVGTVANVTALNKSGGTGSVQFVVAVSLWALGNYRSGAVITSSDWKTNNSLKITFTGQNWGTELPALTSAISYSTAPTKADTLSGIAGAQALAASSAAVLALAALY